MIKLGLAGWQMPPRLLMTLNFPAQTHPVLLLTWLKKILRPFSWTQLAPLTHLVWTPYHHVKAPYQHTLSYTPSMKAPQIDNLQVGNSDSGSGSGSSTKVRGINQMPDQELPGVHLMGMQIFVGMVTSKIQRTMHAYITEILPLDSLVGGSTPNYIDMPTSNSWSASVHCSVYPPSYPRG